MIDFEDFEKVEMRVGKIIAAKTNEKARRPAYVLEIDFGPLGIKTSSAQITEHYDPGDLIGMQVVAVVNFLPKRVAGVKSEVLVVASTGDDGTILLTPTSPVANGSRIA